MKFYVFNSCREDFSDRLESGGRFSGLKARLHVDPTAVAFAFYAPGKLGTEFLAEPVDQRRDGVPGSGGIVRKNVGA